MAIIKQKYIYDDSKKIFINLYKELDDLDKKVKDLIKSNKTLSTSLQTVKKSSDGNEARELVKLTNQLETSTNKLNVSKGKQAELLEKVRIEQSQQKQLNKANAILNDKLTGTEERLIASNTKLRLERKKLIETDKNYAKNLKKINDQIDKNTQKIKGNSDAMKKQKMTIGDYGTALKGLGTKLIGVFAAVQGLRGAFNVLKNIIGSTAEGQMFLAKVSGATTTVMNTFRDSIIDGWNSLIDFGDGIDNTSTLLEKLGDWLVDFYTVRGKGFLKFLDAGKNILNGNFKDALTNVNDGFVQITLGIENATEKTTEYINKMKTMAAFGAAIAGSEKQLELDRSRFAIKEAKTLRTIFDLRAKVADKSNFTAKERQGFLEQAINLTRILGSENEKFANRDLALQQAVFNANKSNIDDEIKLNKLKQKADEIAASSLKKQKLLIAELQTVKNQAAKENKANYERELKDIELIAHKKLTSEQDTQDKITEIVKAAEDNRQRINKERAEDELLKLQDIENAKLAIKKIAIKEGVQLASNIFASFQDEKLAKLNSDSDAEKNILKQRLDNGVISEKQYAEKVAQIEQKQRTESAKAEKKKAIFDIALTTAIGVIKALVALKPILAASIATIGAILAAAIAAKPIPKFEKGKVNINAPSHAKGGKIVEIEGGESYVNKHATSQSEDVLNMVNDGILTDKGFYQMAKKDNNMLIGGLLMQGNKNSSDMIELLSRLGLVYKKGGENYIERASGKIERFI